MSWHAAGGDPGVVCVEGEPAASHIPCPCGVVRYVPLPFTQHSHPLCWRQRDTNTQQSPLGWGCSRALFSGPNSATQLWDSQVGHYQGSASYRISVSETCSLPRALGFGPVLLCYKRRESGRLFKQVCPASQSELAKTLCVILWDPMYYIRTSGKQVKHSNPIPRTA